MATSPAILVPGQRIESLSILNESERHQLLVEWNATKRDYPRDRCVHQLFEEQVARTPDAVAVVFEEQKLTYGELNAKANQLAHHLREMGVGPETLVGICVERSLEMVVGLLGILKAGGAYVPLDPSYPQERLGFMLEDTKAPVLLTQARLVKDLPPHSAQVVCLDGDWGTIAGHDSGNLSCAGDPKGLAYVIYTSGSTGKPKGVAIEHRSTVTFVHWAREVFTSEELSGVLASTSICFDLSVFELFVTLCSGGRIVLIENALRLSSLSPQANVRLINTVPSAIAELLRLNAVPESVLTVNLAGEPLSTELVNTIHRQTHVRRVYDLYGPTEDTTYSTYTLRLPEAPATIGRPIANTQIYILDEQREPVPVGVAGELYIGGDGLARGYLNRPELTAEKFVANPFGEPGSRLYRTGDLARYLPDGNIEFLGRIDHQVKIRGFRIELGEIESVLGQYPGIRQSVVMAREDVPGDKRLVAYLVPATVELPAIDLLRSHLRQKLPEYMVPSAFVVLAQLPLTPNGKIDRKALPAPEMGRGEAGYVAPRNPTEELLAGIFQELLHLDRVGIHDNFFDLGGHSLLATRVVSHVRRLLKVELAIRSLFESPTVSGLAETIAATETAALSPPMQPLPRDKPLPLSFAQQRLWFLNQYETNQAVYNIPLAVHLSGSLEVPELHRALNQIMERHEALRTTFQAVDGEPVQVISPHAEVDLPRVDLSDRPEEAHALTMEEAARPFDLSHGPLLRARLLRLSDREHVLLLSMHHIVSDGWSMGVVFDELKAIYRSLCLGEESGLPNLPVQYADYALWQRQWLAGEILEKQLGYWKKQLAGAPAVLELPTDRPRPITQSYRGAREPLLLPRELSQALTTLSRREGVTLYMTLLAGLKILLHRYSRQDDIVVGSPIAGRNSSETENLIGFFVNTLVLRTDLSGNPTVRELLGRVREVALGAYGHQDLPFEKLVEEIKPQRSLSYSPLFQVLLVLQNAPQSRTEMPELAVTAEDVHSGTSKFDLTLSVEEIAEGLRGTLEYSTDLFEAETIRRMLDHLRRLLEGMAADPQQPIGLLPMLSKPERHQLLVEWNATKRDYPRDRCVHQLFEEQVARTPDAVAVVFESQSLTYAELNAKANQLAHHLREMGVGPETLVGICVERSLEMVVGLLGILKAGGAYVPLDPSYPKERLGFMLEDTKAPVLLTQNRLLAGLPKHSARVICLESDWPQIESQSRENPVCLAGPENLAYVIYTSGSTGTPKGVMIEHRQVVRLFAQTQDWFQFSHQDVWTLFHSYAFDFSVWEIWGALLYGGRLVVVPYLVSRSPEQFLSLLVGQAVTVLNQTPSAFHQLARVTLSSGTPSPLALRAVIFGGEALELNSLRPWFERFGDRCPLLVNMYGITETTVHVTYRPITLRDLDAGAGSVIGRPIPDLQLHVLDEHQQPLPLGVTGELYVGGEGLGRGYLNRPELTAQRFVPDSFNPEPGCRLYRTGDLARYLANGDLEYLGRIDHQVKIRGFRIELGEIESVLGQYPGIRQSVVVAREDVPGDKRLVAYLVPATAEPPAIDPLRSHLRQKLPEYMVPSAFVVLAQLPLTPNGKIDRKALPAPEMGRGEAGYVAPRNPTEELLAGIFQELLHLDRVGIHDNFFNLGGHSLLATRMVSRIRQTLGVELSLRSLFESPTVVGLAAAIAAAETTALSLSIQPVPRDKPLPLSFAQQRLWFLDQLDPGRSDYNITYAGRLAGELDRIALERAVRAVVCRHESLRTTFRFIDGETVQVISPDPLGRLIQVDMASLSAAEREGRVQELVAAESLHRFDLATGPLVRFGLLCVSAQDHVLLITIHHAVADGWSMALLAGDLAAFYAAEVSGSPVALPELSIQYADFSVWQRQWLQGDALERQTAYWKRQMGGELVPLELPADRRRVAECHDGACRVRQLPRQLFESLRSLCRREQVTMPMTMLAAFLVLLHRHSGQDEVTVGMPVAGRTHAETEGLVGLFVNMLALRTSLDGNPAFADLLARVREVMLSAYAHQDLPFEKLVELLQPERDLGRNPIFDVVFNYLNMPEADRTLANLVVTELPEQVTQSKMPLTFYVQENSDGLRLQMSYQTAIFSEQRIDLLLEQLHALLDEITESPERCIWTYSLVTASARPLLPDPRRPLAGDFEGSVLGRFVSRARETPDREAIVDAQGPWTYRQLDELSNRLAGRLIAGGVRRGDIVAIYAHRSAPLALALLGVMKAGAAFAILDANYPAARLQQYAKLVRSRVLIHIEAAGDVPHEIRVVAGAAGCCIALPSTAVVAERLLADVLVSASERMPLAADVAYIAFTSGTTGVPKAVLGTHGPLAHFIDWHTRTFQLTADDRFSFLSGMGHDPALRDIFTPLWLGGTLCIPGSEMVRHGDGLLEWMRQQRISVAHLTPAMGELLTQGQLVKLDLLRHASVAGDVLTRHEVAALRRLAPHAKCVNFYGTTETPQAMGCFVVPEERVEAAEERSFRETIPLGRGIDDVQLLVLNRSSQLAGIGEIGEIHVRTPYLSAGYVGDAELTAERFLPDPHGSGPAWRMYRTGDLGRYLPDGNVQFLGRADQQVKIRGFRVELGEIETVLARHPAIRQCVVVAREDNPGDKRLVAYVVAQDSRTPGGAELGDHVTRELPEFMVPTAFVIRESLPMTPNGKVDLRSLPSPEVAGREAGYVAPRNATEQLLSEIWAEVLKIGRVGIHDDFFDLGGHSLLAIRLMVRIHEVFRRKLALSTLFQGGTIERLAKCIAGDSQRARWVTPVPLSSRGSGSPIFWLPGAGGLSVIAYRRISSLIGAGRPVYGMEASVERARRPWDLRSRARAYIDAMLAVEPRGPYSILGFCVGGWLAFEIALQLRKMGHAVGSLVVFDMEVVDFAPPLVGVRMAAQVARYHADQLRRLPVRQWLRYAREEFVEPLQAFSLRRRNRMRSELVVATSELADEFAAADRESQCGIGEYERSRGKEKYPGKITVVIADDNRSFHGVDSRLDPRLGWRYLASEGIDVHRVAGQHASMLEEPNVQVLAAVLNAVLEHENADQGASGMPSQRAGLGGPSTKG